MFILPCAPSQWGGVGQDLQSSNAAQMQLCLKEREEQIPPSALLSHWYFSRAGDRVTSHVSMTESPQSCIRKGPGQGIGDKFIQTLLLLIPLRVLLQVT